MVVVTLSTGTCGAGGEALGNWAANDEPGDNGAVMLSEIFFCGIGESGWERECCTAQLIR